MMRQQVTAACVRPVFRKALVLAIDGINHKSSTQRCPTSIIAGEWSVGDASSTSSTTTMSKVHGHGTRHTHDPRCWNQTSLQLLQDGSRMIDARVPTQKQRPTSHKIGLCYTDRPAWRENTWVGSGSKLWRLKRGVGELLTATVPVHITPAILSIYL